MKKLLLIVPVIYILAGCGGKKNNPTPTPVPQPSQAILAAPAQNAVCTAGTILSTTESSIVFNWSASDNTTTYVLVIKNLLTSDSTVQNTSQTQLIVSLSRGTPYSWYVVSKSSQTTATAKSAVWKFYNSGPGVVTYAPFPAEITSPTLGQIVTTSTGTVNLVWVGSAVSPDLIANYDAYFGTTSSPPIVASAITNSFFNNVNVRSGTTYYWRIVTRDINGNTSDSGLYQFSVN